MHVQDDAHAANMHTSDYSTDLQVVADFIGNVKAENKGTNNASVQLLR